MMPPSSHCAITQLLCHAPSCSISFFLLTVLIICASVVVPAAAAAALHPAACKVNPAPSQCRTVCAFTNTDLAYVSGHTAGAMMFYENILNGTTASPLVWNLNLIQTSPNRSTAVFSPFEVVQAWDRDRFKKVCDVLIGSGKPDVDISLVGSIDVPWMEPIVALAPLTNRVEFPNILNTIPLLSSVAETFIKGFGSVSEWAVLSDDTTTSRAWLKAIKHDDSIKLSVLREIAEDSSSVGISSAITDVMAARTRFVLVLNSFFSTKFNEAYATLAKEAAARPNSKVFLFIDEICPVQDFKDFAGSFCVTYKAATADPTKLTVPNMHNYNGYHSYVQTNAAQMKTTHTSVGFSVFGFAAGHFEKLFHDTVLHYMLVANKDPTRIPTREDLRTNVSGGSLGLLSYNSNGVRPSIRLEMINIAANGSRVSVAETDVGNFTWNEIAPAYMLGAQESIKALPNTFPPVPESPASKTTLIIGLAAGGVVLLIVVLAGAYVLKTVLAPDARNNSAAPKDESKPFAVAFTDIQASTALWAAAPQAMSGAVEQHHALIRQLIAEFKGYEVKTIGDSFMVAFSSPAKAVAFSQELQRLFYNTSWPDEIDRGYIGQAADSGLGEGATDPELWNGLRVRVGIHYDTGRITLDPVTKGYDYYGTVTNTAARVETIGNGGQVLLTAAALEAAEKESPGVTNQCVVTDLGEENLRGLNEATRLYQVVPKEFELREFPPLRVDRLENEEFEDLEQEGHSGDLQMDSDATPHGSPRKSVLSDHKTKASSVSSHPEGTEGAYVAFLEVLLSPLPDNERGTVLAFFVQRWRVAASTKSSALGSNKKVAKKAIEGVAKRAGAAHQCLLQGNEADMGESSSVPPRTGGRRSTGQRKSSTQQTHQQPLPNPFAGRKSGAGAMYRTHSGHLEPHGSGYLPQHPKGSIGSDRMSVQSTSP